MEVKKFHDLSSVSWRSKKAGSVIQSESKGLRTRRSDVQGQEKMESQRKQREQIFPSTILSHAGPWWMR